MEFLIDFILHIDKHLIEIVQDYHTWAYAILFMIIFCETASLLTKEDTAWAILVIMQ